MKTIAAQPQDLAERLRVAAERGDGDAYYRLARIVARVLVSHHLRQRHKWCALARSLSSTKAVEERPTPA